jgi:hypothetical protein
VSSKERWLETMWPRIRSHLPAAPAVVVEVGCGSLGGFVPALENDGYRAVGIDPHAPEGTSYRRIEFERSDPVPADPVVACTSLHHVADPSVVLDRIAAARGPYLFSDLPEGSEAEELRAIDAGQIRALRVDYVGRRR